MSWEILLLVAVQGVLMFLLGLLLGCFRIPKQVDQSTNKVVQLWKASIFEMEESTKRSIVQLSSLRARLVDFDRTLGDKRLSVLLGELTEHVRVLQLELQILQSHSKTLSLAAHDVDSETPLIESSTPETAATALPADNSWDHELNSFLAAVEEKARSGVPLHDLLGFVYDEIQPFISCQRMGSARIDYEADLVTANWYHSEKPGLLTGGYAAPLSSSSLRFIAGTGRPRVLNDLPKYLRQHSGSDSTRLIVSEGFRSSLTLPISVDGTAVAFLFLSSSAVNGFDKTSAAIGQQLVDRISCSPFLAERATSVAPAMTR